MKRIIWGCLVISFSAQAMDIEQVARFSGDKVYINHSEPLVIDDLACGGEGFQEFYIEAPQIILAKFDLEASKRIAFLADKISLVNGNLYSDEAFVIGEHLVARNIAASNAVTLISPNTINGKVKGIVVAVIRSSSESAVYKKKFLEWTAEFRNS